MTVADSVFLVVPCYRESGRIGAFLPDLCREIELLDSASRILVVDDGSGEDEQARMKKFIDDLRPRHPCLLPLLELPHNLGKGGAVYEGWKAHSGQSWLGFVDADGSCSAAETARLARAAFANPGKCVIASRMKILGRRIDRKLARHLLGRVYATFVSELLHIPVYDTQCGLKIIPRQAFERISHLLTVRGFAFDVQLLAALLDSGCEVIEEPVDWHETPGGKVRLIRDSFRMFFEILAIRRERAAERWKTAVSGSRGRNAD